MGNSPGSMLVIVVLVAAGACSKSDKGATAGPAADVPGAGAASGSTKSGAATTTETTPPPTTTGDDPTGDDPTGDDPTGDEVVDDDPPGPGEDPAAQAAGPGGDHPAAVTIGRRFDAREDNAAAEPAMFSQDGDFLMWNDRCGLYADTGTNALYVVCDGEVKSSPIRTSEEVADVMRQVSAQSRAGHDATQDIINNYPTGGSGKRDHFDDQGNFKGNW